MRRLRDGIWLVLAVVACQRGATVERFEPARGPAGAEVLVRLRRVPVRRIVGELITVRDSDLLVLDSAAFWRIPLHAIAYAEVEVRGAEVSIRQGRVIGSRERLARLSRYPQGVPDDLLRRLLVAYGRDSVRAVP
jgi:hypothetical protein